MADSGWRHCAMCDAPSAIALGEPLWPVAWQCRSCLHTLATQDGRVQLAPGLDDSDDGYDIDSFAFLARVEADHFWFKSRNDLVAWLVKTHARSARRVIEIGCGTGYVLGALQRTLPGAQIAGSELHSKGLEIAARRYGAGVELIQMDARKTGLRDAVDVVGAFDVLEHIAEDEAVLAEVTRMLKPGGVLIATVPQHPWLWGPNDDIAHHQRRYKVGELSRKAAAAGLTPLYRSSFVTLAFPVMAASRLLRGTSDQEAVKRQRVESEFEISPGINRAMLAVQRIEHGLRRGGVPLPFGGSQVVVARKPM
jgi:SAM-dependent methyltransferase